MVNVPEYDILRNEFELRSFYYGRFRIKFMGKAWPVLSLQPMGQIVPPTNSHNLLYIHICMQKHNVAIKTSGHSSLEKYTSHFIERVVCERELETEQRLQHIDPPNSSSHGSASFSFSWAAQPEAWGPRLSAEI